MQRPVFFISDGTGITAETLGRSLISQFKDIDFQIYHLPYIDSPEKAIKAVEKIDEAFQEFSAKPLIFSTLVDDKLRTLLAQSSGLFIDLFDVFVKRLEIELGAPASHETGRLHGVHDVAQYSARIEAINYTLETDDGLNPRDYDAADLILLGVSRSGKTPTSLYLALHYGLATANYPLTEDDLSNEQLPVVLRPYVKKCYGLTIDPVRLHHIRSQRRREGRYALLQQCKKEVDLAKHLFKIQHIAYLDTTQLSVEEIATHIVANIGFPRRLS